MSSFDQYRDDQPHKQHTFKLGDDGEIESLALPDELEKPKRGQPRSGRPMIVWPKQEAYFMPVVFLLIGACCASYAILGGSQSPSISSSDSFSLQATRDRMGATQTALSQTLTPLAFPLPRIQPCSALLKLAGDKIAFMADYQGQSTVYVMDIDTGFACQPVERDAAFLPAWSPNGRYLAFLARPGATRDLLLLDRELLLVKRITENAWIAQQPPVWSSNSKYLMYRIREPGETTETYVIADWDGSNRRVLEHIKALGTPSWSPNSEQIAFVAENRDVGTSTPQKRNILYLANFHGLSLHTLTHDVSADDTPAWSPDGQIIAFVSGQDGKQAIYTVSKDGSTLHRLTDLTSNNWQPRWSPDGQQLAFVSDRQGKPQVFLMNADGSRQEQLISELLQTTTPVWSSNGKYLAFIGGEATGQGIYVVRVADLFDERTKRFATVVDTLKMGIKQATSVTWMPSN